MKIHYAKTITALNPNVSFTINNDDLDNIVWHEGNPTNITKEQILAKQTELQTIEDAKPENINKTSGKAKLKSGDALTDAEISALFGDN